MQIKAAADIFQHVFQHSARAAAVVDQQGRIHLANPAFRDAVAAGERLPGFMLDSLRLRGAFQTAGQQVPARFLITDPQSGRDQPATLTMLPEDNANESLYLIEFHGHWEETRLEAALQESEQRYFTLQQNLPVGIYRANQSGDLEAVNEALLRMMGYQSFAELQMAELEDVWVDVDERDQLIRRLRAEGVALGHIVHLKRKDGSEFIGSFDARGNFDEQGRLIYFDTIVQDITEKVKAQEVLERLATSDSLTGLANRQHLMSRLEEEVKRSERYAVPFTLLMIDLDHFKTINDSMGHQAGDEVLRAFATLISDCLRKTDFAGRYGGEEFCVALPETDLDGGVVIAERILKSVEGHAFRVPGREPFYITCSIGAAGAASNTVESLVAAADEQLYKAKREGRNRVEVNRAEKLKS